MKIPPSAIRLSLGEIRVNSMLGEARLTVEVITPGYVIGKGLAVLLHDEDGPYATLSVNALGIESSRLAENEFCARLWDNNSRLRPDLLASGLFSDTGRRACLPDSQCQAEIWRIDPARWEAAQSAAHHE